MKKRSLIPSILIVLSLMMLLPTSVFAWFSFQNNVTLVNLETSQMDVSIEVDENQSVQVISQTITTDTLTYIDFNKDIVLNTSGALNHIASSIGITLSNSEDSITVKNRINLDTLNEQALIYLVVVEGKNIEENHEYIRDYYNYIQTIISSGSTLEQQRNLIDSHNQNMLQYIESVSLFASETLTFQLVFWADYDRYQGLNYLDHVYNLALNIDSIQVDGEF